MTPKKKPGKQLLAFNVKPKKVKPPKEKKSVLTLRDIPKEVREIIGDYRTKPGYPKTATQVIYKLIPEVEELKKDKEDLETENRKLTNQISDFKQMVYYFQQFNKLASGKEIKLLEVENL